MQNAECRMKNVERIAAGFSILHSAFCVLHSKRKGATNAPLQITKREFESAEQSFFLQLLTVDAVRRAGDGLQSLLANDVSTIDAFCERVVFDAIEGFFDLHQQVALGIRQREVELFR